MSREFAAITLAHRNGLRLSVGDFVEIMPTISTVKTHVIFLSAIARNNNEELLLNGPSFYAFRDDEREGSMELFFDQERLFYPASRALHVVSLRIKTRSVNVMFDGPNVGAPSYVAHRVRKQINAKPPFPGIPKGVSQVFLEARAAPISLPVAVLDDPCLRYWEGCDAQSLTFDEWQALNRMSENIPSLSVDALAKAYVDPDSKHRMHPAIYGLACLILAITEYDNRVTPSLRAFVRGFVQDFSRQIHPSDLFYEAKLVTLFATNQVQLRDSATPMTMLYQWLSVFVKEKSVMGPYLAHVVSRLIRKILMSVCAGCGKWYQHDHAPLCCGACYVVHYCDIECQKKNWKYQKHRMLCVNHETSRGGQLIWLLEEVDQAKTAEEYDVLMTRVNALRS